MNYDQWKKHPHGPLAIKRLEAFESRLRCHLPSEFRRWLEEVNGGKPEDACIAVSDDFGFACFHHIYGFSTGPDYSQLDKANHILEGNLNAGLVAFADDAGGNQFTISVRPEDFGAVIFWDHETVDEHVLAGNFQEFISSLRNEDEFIKRGDLEKILRADDSVLLERWLQGKPVNDKDDEGCTPLEWAAVYAAVKCISYLHSRGARAFDALKYAERNLEYFEDHRPTVDLLKKLYPEESVCILPVTLRVISQKHVSEKALKPPDSDA